MEFYGAFERGFKLGVGHLLLRVEDEVAAGDKCADIAIAELLNCGFQLFHRDLAAADIDGA